MKQMGTSLLACLALYCRIPMPHIEWNARNTRYTLGFLPLIGVWLGGLEYLWYILACRLELDSLLYAAVAVLLPTVLTGGIHLDGFLDTCDAVSSYGTKERKLEILSDPHAGAFGIIYTLSLLVLQTGLFAQIYAAGGALHAVAAGYILSRVVGAGALVLMPYAKNTGMGYEIGKNSSKAGVCTMLFLFCFAAFAWLCWYVGAVAVGISLILLIAIVFLLRRFAIKLVGGITGDLCGFAICITETAFLICSVGIGLVMR